MNILKKLSQRERIIVYILAAIILCALLYNFLIEPLAKKWINLNSEINRTNVKLRKSISLLKDKADIDKEYAQYAEKLKPKESDEQELTSILNELEVLARRSNLKIVSMRPKPAKDEGYYRIFVVDIETESDMGSLMKFIYDIKNSPQLLKVNRLNLNTKSSQQGTLIRASMIISRISLAEN